MSGRWQEKRTERETSPFWALRLVAENDGRLSFPARHVFNRILSMRVRVQADIDDVFPLPWSKVSGWLGREEKMSLAYLSELETRGYLKREGIEGCPPTRQVRIVRAMMSKTLKKDGLKTPKKDGLKTPKKDGLKTPQKDGLKTPEKDGHLINSLSDKEELIGSLRSPERKGKKSSGAAGGGRKLSRSESLEAFRKAKQEAGFA